MSPGLVFVRILQGHPKEGNHGGRKHTGTGVSRIVPHKVKSGTAIRDVRTAQGHVRNSTRSREEQHKFRVYDSVTTARRVLTLLSKQRVREKAGIRCKLEPYAAGCPVTAASRSLVEATPSSRLPKPGRGYSFQPPPEAWQSYPFQPPPEACEPPTDDFECVTERGLGKACWRLRPDLEVTSLNYGLGKACWRLRPDLEVANHQSIKTGLPQGLVGGYDLNIALGKTWWRLQRPDLEFISMKIPSSLQPCFIPYRSAQWGLQ
ncbi:hypothetical protein Bbelb_165980 [Branchiostoma belcheri]|nr:hypothetical protein Bbelb_165980 [Branchiostoma belcheri]